MMSILAQLVTLLAEEKSVDRENRIQQFLRDNSSHAADFLNQIVLDHEIDGQIKIRAVILLGKVGDHTAIETLIDILNRNDIKLRQAAIEALGETENIVVIKPLIRMLSYEDVGILQAVAHSLSKMPQDATPMILQSLKEIPQHAISYVIRALGSIKDVRAIDTLLDMSSHSSPSVRNSAIVALGLIGDERGLDSILDAIQDPVIYVRQSAIYALGSFVSPQAEKRAIEASFEENFEIVDAAVMSLGEMATDAALKRLLEIAKDESIAEEIQLTAIWQLCRSPNFAKKHIDELPTILNCITSAVIIEGW